MSNLDYGRKQDLEELAESMANAKSTAEREYYEKIMYRILNESEGIREWREELIKAVRVNDKRRQNLVIDMIQRLRQEETYGKSWGNNKGERSVN